MVSKNKMLSDIGGGGEVASILEKNWICALTGHHAEPNINILLAQNLPFDSYVRH